MVLHILFALLLLVIPAGVLFIFDKSLLRTLSVAVGRMAIQLLVLCLIVWVLVKYDALWLSLLWLVSLTVLSGVLVLQRVKLPLNKFLLPVGAGLLVSVLLVGAYLLLVCLPTASAFGARWFVPVMALLTGHTITTLIRGLSTYQSALKADEQLYEFRRGNGSDHLHAVLPFVKRALQQVFAPTAANLSVMGLYTMPFLVCGILLAGVAPINAFVVTLMLVCGCLATSVIALLMTLWLADWQLFDKLGKLQ